MQIKRMLFVSLVLILGLCPLLAESPDYTITYSLNGTLGPNLNGGPDCLVVNGDTTTATAAASSTLVPTSTTANSATYSLPAGAINASVGSLTFTNTSPWKMKYTLGAAGDNFTLSGPGPLGSTVTANSNVVAGSFSKAVLMHPTPLVKAHQPQNLTSPKSYLSYQVPSLGCTLTKLGFTGTIGTVPATPTSGR